MKKLFSYYSGNIYKSECIGQLTLNQFLEAHQNPTNETVDLIGKIREASNGGNKKLKSQLKTKLFAFTPSVKVAVGSQKSK